MNLRKVASSVFIISFLLTTVFPIAVVAQGSALITTEISSFNAPSTVEKDVAFNMSASARNKSVDHPDPTFHIPMRLDQCALYTQQSTNPNQNTHNIELVTFSSVTYNGTTYLMDIQQGSLGGVPTVIPRTDLIIESGDSINLNFSGKASLEVEPGDLLYTTFSCTFYATGPNPIGGDNFGEAPTSNRLSVSVASDEEPIVVTPPADEGNPLLGVQLPEIFTMEGSETTKLGELESDQLDDLKNFKLDIPERGSITFTDGIDFTDGEVITKLHVLDDYIEIGEGFVEIESEDLPQFNVAATIELNGVNLVESRIEILKDGESAEGEVSNFRYDSSENTLIFDVEEFSKYQIGTGLRVQSEETDGNLVITGSVSDLDSRAFYSVDGRESATDIDIDEEGEFTIEFNSGEVKEKVLITAVGTTGVTKDSEIKLAATPDLSEEEGSNNIYWALLLLLITGVVSGGGFYIVKRKKLAKSKMGIEPKPFSSSSAIDSKLDTPPQSGSNL